MYARVIEQSGERSGDPCLELDLHWRQGAARMESSSSSPQDCDRQLCQYHGRCVSVDGEPFCECLLGYRGTFCHDRVSDSIGVPLTLGVLGVLAGILLLAFSLRFIWKRVKIYNTRKVVGAAQSIPMVDIGK
ncbi:hypothetical protein SKAU_G00283740 [Synaphobranchus kaupii]|uniref:EGF-like domain-containing protein n=1 Tax=Synaphobranchus kaupii TaxID=118154 RepID=A0A9Q1IP93_SYNKA|nr:hypothetical protein SKAU_G00283740 [Synaphobranchus kaupii]